MPDVELRIAVWTVNTYTANISNGNAFTGQDFDYRLERLKEAVETARLFLDASAKGEVLKVFIGPEYLFAKAPTQRLVETDSALKVKQLAQKLSTGILLIPGTIAWRKPIDRQQDVVKKETVGLRTVKLRKTMDDFIRANTEYYKYLGRQPPELLALGEAETVLQNLKELEQVGSQGEPAFIARNTAYVYYDGMKRLTYHKRDDATELLTADKKGEAVRFIPGYSDGYFTVPGFDPEISCGIEVCADHKTAYIRNSRFGGNLHLHFVTSAEIDVTPERAAVMPGGYIVHACSTASKSGVYKADGLNRAGFSGGLRT